MMRGYTTNYVNLIADNLRDRYKNGLPILKELIQNADDAKARQLIFGRHSGFPDSRHPLLQGPGLWFINDGEFRKNDAEDLRSFGIGSKAGDANTIGKFGLGMKSVFHLCEALFYVAWDGVRLHREGLTPWKQESHSLHREWDDTSDADWDRLRALADELLGRKKVKRTWFLLWLPLRMRKHLRTQAGEETGPIISRFPGDEPAGELAFLDKASLAHDVAEILPLLRHLERVEHKGKNNHFVLRLTDATRLMGKGSPEQIGGKVMSAGRRRLSFSGRRMESPDADGEFAAIKKLEAWPRTWSRDELGRERPAVDQASPKGAVMFCSGRRGKTRSRLQWAVFLPVEDGSEDLRGDHGECGHSLILHGQFFLDAGRRKIHDQEHLHEEPASIGETPIDESRVRTAWNQRLAQDVVLPLVLPTLDDHARRHGLPDDECRELAEAVSKSKWFKAFRRHVCRDGVWLRTLERTNPRWRLVEGKKDRSRLRPFPKPPESAPERPWKVFPKLAVCRVMPYDAEAPNMAAPRLGRAGPAERVIPYDAEAPYLSRSDKPGDWQQEELVMLLYRIDGLFVDGPSMDYVIAFLAFLKTRKGTRLYSEPVQRRFLEVLRHGLRAAGLHDRRSVAAKASRLFGFLQSKRRIELKDELPEPILKDLWAIDAPVLLVPKGMEPEEPSKASPAESDLADWLRASWLRVLDGALDSNDTAHLSILQAMKGLLPLSAEDRRRFLKKYPTLRVVGVRDVRNRIDRPVSVEYLNRVRANGCLFTFAEGLREARLGIAPLLAQAIPDADVRLVRAPDFLEFFSEEESQGRSTQLPAASNGQACLAAVGRYDGQLGDIDNRRRLLKRANDPGTDEYARRGLRFLLHGSLDHRDNDAAKLWIGRHDQHTAWKRLWTVMHKADGWSLVAEELVDVIPRKSWRDANTAEIDAETLIDELRKPGRGLDALEELSPAEREEILSHLDARDTIEIALAASRPVDYWRYVMDALGRLKTIDEDLRRRLRRKAWLPTTRGKAVKPRDVIDLQGSLSDVAHRRIAEHREAHGHRFAVPEDLDRSVPRDNKAWSRLCEVGFSSGAEGLGSLGSLLEDLPNYHIGKWTEQPRPDVTGLLAHCAALPGWRLLQMAAAKPFDPETAWNQLGSTLSRELEPRHLLTVLNWLSQDNDEWKLRKAAHDDYLRQLTAHRQSVREYLPRLRLASANEDWRRAAELCAGAYGVVSRSLLDQKQEAILGNLIRRADPGARGGQPDTPPVDFRQTGREAREILHKYFRTWDGTVEHPIMIGVVLALLGPDVRKLANEYLRPHHFEWLKGELPFKPCMIRDLPIKDLDDELGLVRVVGVRVDKEDEVEVCSLLGHPIRVAFDERPDTLLAGPIRLHGGSAVVIPLRQIDPGRFQTKLPEILRATAERLYFELYNQKDANFGSLWEELAKSDQLKIGIARRLILDHIVFYLRQLSVTDALIREQLEACENLRNQIAEAEHYGKPADDARKKLRKEHEKLAERIDQNYGEQQAVLRAVRSKVEQYQYRLSSIPLELFQNADDAAVELGQCLSYPSKDGEAPKTARRFVVEEREDGLGFLHWGRRINDLGPVGFDGRSRGYDRDLEKMLILAGTDKHADKETTGKFGLGFKSVLLACDQPRIISGHLAIRVVAGILPQPWEEIDGARQRLADFSKDPNSGTLIDLPGVNGEVRAAVLERFLVLAGVLCVFGRAIRSVKHVGTSESWSWRPEEICPDVEVGDLHLRGKWGTHTKALCIRAGDGSLLMALGPQGFRPLPDAVPALWVTGPTEESSAVGFAVNGNFDLDAGRGRLAGDADNNLNKARRIGQQVGDVLGALLERSHKDWNSVQATLGLAAVPDDQSFWESVWSGLTKGWLTRSPRDRNDLTRKVALGALDQLRKRPRAIPNGLKGSLRSFADAGEIRYELSGVLLQEDVGEELSTWKRFRSSYPANECVSKEIGSILREVTRDAKLGSPQFLRSIGLSDLAGLPERSRVELADAEVLGRVRLLTKDEKDWESDNLPERLNGLLFRSEAGEWTEARKLLARHAPDELLDPDETRDEQRRHELAPPKFRLHPDYYAERDGERPAVAFFRVCRQRMDAPAKLLAQWVLDAESVTARLAALEYLADGELGERVAELVRGRGWRGWLRTALDDFQLTKTLKEEQLDRLRRRLIPLVWPPYPPPFNGSVDCFDLATALEDIYGWWSREGNDEAPKYRDRLYPDGFLGLNLKPDRTGRADPSSWFTLFALGSFQGMGRTREGQHRSFIQRCQYNGWWKVFTDSDPKEQPERWMNIIEEYAEVQDTDEEWMQWFGQFPKLYRLRRWLDVYVELFLSIDRFQEPFTKDMILAPRSNPQFQGGGIDAPPLTRTLRLGFYLVVRELLHHGMIENLLAIPHAYAPIGRIRSFFEAGGTSVSTSEDIYQLLTDHLGEDRATFGGDYDIPLRIISSDDSMRYRVLNRRGQ